MGNTEIEDSLEKLDRLTLEEVRIAAAELLKVTHNVEGKVQDVRSDVQDVRGDMQHVGDKIQGVDDRMQRIGSDVKDEVRGIDDRVQRIGNDIKDEVRCIDDKLDQVTRSLSLYHLLIVPSAQTSLQGINSGIVFYDGFLHQIHPSIITLRARLITTVQLNGFFKAVYSINGNPMTPSCGYTGSVSYSWPSPCDDH